MAINYLKHHVSREGLFRKAGSVLRQQDLRVCYFIVLFIYLKETLSVFKYKKKTFSFEILNCI